MKRIGILYHPEKKKARPLAEEIGNFLSSQGISFWQCSAREEDEAKANLPGSDLLLGIGGDGTILRAARLSAPWSVPLTGVNLGKLGFMTELDASEILEKLPQLLSGNGWVDERVMLQAEVLKGKQETGRILHALNDVALVRGSSTRLVSIETRIDAEFLTAYRADGVIASTATGSTGYSLAAGGPILHPRSRGILLQPVCPHLSLHQPLVLSSETVIELRVTTGFEAILSVDSQVEIPLASGDGARVKLSPYATRFLRLHPKGYFYSSLEEKLKGKK